MEDLLLLGADLGESEVIISRVQLHICTALLSLIRLLLGREPPESGALGLGMAHAHPPGACLQRLVYPGLPGGLSQPFQPSWRTAPAGRRQGRMIPRDDSASRIGGSEK